MTQTEVWTTLKVLEWTRNFLTSRGVENSRSEAEWLLCAATGLDRVGLYLNFDKPMNDGELTAFRQMVSRRGRREPLQHILGTQEFYGLEFEVTPDVLIPRHDTETLVETALRLIPEACSLLDIGTGSGCIAIALADRLRDAKVTAVDISHAALEVARRNANKIGVTIEFLQGSLLEPVADRQFDLIVSNPPYIPSGDLESLQPEVRDFDPRGALDGGLDGLDFYRKLVPSAVPALTIGGWLLVEVGTGQAEEVLHLFGTCNGYEKTSTACDPAGTVRVVGGQRK